MGEKNFSFAQMEFKSKTDQAKKELIKFEENPKAFEPPPKPKPAKRDLVKKTQASTASTWSASEVDKMK